MLMFCLSIFGLVARASASTSAADSPRLMHREHSFRIRLNGSVAEVTALFGPVREAEWSPEWRPQFIHPLPGAQLEGAVFTTGNDDQLRIWMLNKFDVDAGRVEYAVVTPGLTANQIKIAVVADGDGRSKATITYRHTALTLEGNEQVEKLDERWAEEQRSHWEIAINQALRDGVKN